jgi:hypothetical protein
VYYVSIAADEEMPNLLDLIIMPQFEMYKYEFFEGCSTSARRGFSVYEKRAGITIVTCAKFEGYGEPQR